MKKSLSTGIAVALGLAAVVATPSASAFNLSITAGTHTCLYGPDAAIANGCLYGAASTTGGAYFLVNGDYANSLSSNVGLEVGPGTAQSFVGTAGSAGSGLDPDPGTNPGIDQNITAPIPFFALSSYLVHFTLSDILLTDTGAGTAAADMSGWRYAWGEVPVVDVGTDGGSGAFTYDGVNWTLDFSSTVAAGDPSGTGGTPYDLHLEGTYTGDITSVIAAAAPVPVPAAAWLFGSGLIGLIGVARRRQSRV